MILLYIAATVAFLLFLSVSVVRSMHMFQLNSYKAPTHWRWLGKNKQSLIPGLTGAALAAGILLKPMFRGTGYDENQRTYGDFGSDLYIIEKAE